MKSSNAGLDELNLSKKCAAAWNSLAIGPGNEFVISRYQGIYPLLSIDTNGEFNNLDFKNKKEITWLENKIYVK